jgi:pyrimidine oxygenase
MEIGVFLPTASNNYIPTHALPRWQPNYPDILEITRIAERIGMDFVLNMVKFRGPGGDTGYWDAAYESMTLSSALLAHTERIRVIASVGILSVHPAMTARMMATLDGIAPGRTGLNIVTGWNPMEYSQMGLWPGDSYFRYRYAYAAEYVEILRGLWADGSLDFEGEHFTLTDCHVRPTPAERIPILSAGSSDAGMRFAAAFSDLNFTENEPLVADKMQKLQDAAALTGRDVGSYVQQPVVIADTDDEALALVRLYNEQADRGALAGRGAQSSRDTVSDAGSTSKRLASAAQAGVAIPEAQVIAGSPRTVATHLQHLSSLPGVKGVMLSFDDFFVGMKRFGAEVMPLLH